MQFLGISDTQKIGLMLIGVGVLLLSLGCLLFFDAGLLAIGNVLFLAGFPFVSGWRVALQFFNPIDLSDADWYGRVRGKLLFWAGFVLVLMRWGLVGMIIEVAGIVLLFARFLKPMVQYGRDLPVVGTILRLPGVSSVVGMIDDSRRPPV